MFVLNTTDRGKSPTFQEKFVYSLIEGLTELNVIIWNSNTLSHDEFIGSGKVQLANLLSQGFDDSFWPLQTKTGRHAGEVRLIMHYSSANNPIQLCSSIIWYIRCTTGLYVLCTATTFIHVVFTTSFNSSISTSRRWSLSYTIFLLILILIPAYY